MRKFIVVLLLFVTVFLSADQFVTEFYNSVNIYRNSLGLSFLRENDNVGKIATTYSEILSELGYLDHNALSKFEFVQLCKNYGIENVILGEVLCAFPSGYTANGVLDLFKSSKKHNDIIIDKDGKEIGAGYVNLDGRIYFTAYILIRR